MTLPRLVVEPPRIALTRAESAAALGCSPSFFDERIRPELRCIRRGAQVLWATAELQRWAEDNSEQPITGGRAQ